MDLTLRGKIIKATLCRSWLPRHCISSGRNLHGKYAYKITTQHYTENGYVHTNTHWMASSAYLLLQLMAV